MKGRLLALSSAAVLAVYTAGYARTRSAAEMLDAEERRPPMPRPGSTDRTPIPAAPADPSVVPVRAAADVAGATAAPSVSARIAQTGSRTADGTAPDATIAANTRPQGSANQDSRNTVSAAPSSTQALAPVRPNSPDAPAVANSAATEGSAPAAAQVATVAQVPAVALVDAPVASAAPAAPSVPILKDGKYTGWGTCRHGDLQATILIENGRIATASISQCLTRYPCDWIRPLPPQVVQRQSALVDFISGATESTNAFYYAVLQAIGKAQQ